MSDRKAITFRFVAEPERERERSTPTFGSMTGGLARVRTVQFQAVR